MKFGKLFLTQQRREWEGQYLNYKQLKQWMKSARGAGVDGEEARDAFVRLLAQQLRKSRRFSEQERIRRLVSTEEVSQETLPAGDPSSRAEAEQRQSAEGESEPLLKLLPGQALHPRRAASGYGQGMRTDSTLGQEAISREGTPHAVDRQQEPGTPLRGKTDSDLAEFEALNQVALRKIAKKFHKNFSEAPTLPLAALQSLLQHGQEQAQGQVDLVLYSHGRRSSMATEHKRHVTRHAWFTKQPVMSINVYDRVASADSTNQPRIEVQYTVPCLAWTVLCILFIIHAPVTAMQLGSYQVSTRGTPRLQDFLAQSVLGLTVALISWTLWTAANAAGLTSFGGESLLKGIRESRGRYLIPLAVSGVAHATYQWCALSAASETKGMCGDTENKFACPPLLLQALAPVMLCALFGWVDDVHQEEWQGAVCITAAAGVALFDTLPGVAVWEADVWSALTSAAVAADMIADREVAEFHPAQVLVLQRSFAFLSAGLISIVPLLHDDGGVPVGFSEALGGAGWQWEAEGAWLLAAGLSYCFSALTMYMLRHVTILSVAACLGGSMTFGVVTLAPPLYPHVWFPYRVSVQCASFLFTIIGAACTVWGQLEHRSRALVLVEPPPGGWQRDTDDQDDDDDDLDDLATWD